MSVIVLPIALREASSGNAVPAELRGSIAEQEVLDWEQHWKPEMGAITHRLRTAGVDRRLWPQTAHWDWRAKVDVSQTMLANAGYCIACSGMTQGLMILSTLYTCRLPADKGKAMVYVEFLEVAPWNQIIVNGPEPRYRGVGSALFRAAVEYSRAQGFKGRIGLHSLPQTNDWYSGFCGMTDLGRDLLHQNLRYFELPERDADAFIAKGSPP